MSTPILATKLFIPPPRPKVVPRHRLIERLNQGLHRKLTLISAPAGFGKTTLVSEWIASNERPAAWLSLEEADSDPTRFLAYFVAALQTLVLSEAEGTTAQHFSVGNIGKGVLAALQSPQPPPTESILTALINEITAIPEIFILVLDDYHVIDAKPVNASTSVDDALTFLLEHQPPQMHLVITTREDPNLPLARLRVQDQLTELRVTDLRFTPAEAAGFLNRMMDLNLSTDEVTSLETRTEGWIAGLQLAALSMQGRADIPGFIKAFAGDNRYVVDYLVEEVLHRQPEHVRSFLLQTSILDRLSGPLCDAVTNQEAGNTLLETLERGNLFVVPLDDKRQWYRYHHLFADVLHAHLQEEQPDQVPNLHRRASEWYERDDSPADAIRHALAAEDFERAADLIESAWQTMNRSYQSATLLGWMKILPDELVRTRPVLSVAYAWALLSRGELEASEVWLRGAQRWLDTTADMSERPEALPAEMVVVDEEQFMTLPATIAAARAYHAQALGDLTGNVKYAQQALDLLPESNYFDRGVAAAMLGLAYWASGDLENAHRTFADGMANMRTAGNILAAISGTFVLAGISMALGRLREAITIYEQSLQLATEQGEPVLRGTADLHLGLSELYREQGDLENATKHLLTSQELGERASLPEMQYRSRAVVMARIKQTQGDLNGALDLLREAERRYIRGPVPDVRPVAALKTRVWVAQGKLSEALAWTRERDLSVDDDLSYLREFEHVTLARVLIAVYTRDRAERPIHEAMSLLKRLLKEAEKGRRMASVIEILVLLALAHHAQGNIRLALMPLERALALAEPEGYIRLFVAEGLPMAQLLSAAAARGFMPDYTGRLLAALSTGKPQQSGPSKTQSEIPSPKLEIVEPLSQRELEVLRLVAQGLSNREISERLFLALSTVKGHNRNIYGKLQVQRRTEAVVRARELGLL